MELPTLHSVVLDKLPDYLKQFRNWVHWAFEAKDHNDKPKRHLPSDSAWRDVTKVPTRACTGANASATDPATWTTFEAATANAPERLGFVVTLGSGIVMGDIDDCRDPATGDIDDWAQDIMRAVDSYCELSPSRTGIRFWALTKLPAEGRRCGNLELYDHGRFGTCTGLHIHGTPSTVNECDLSDLHRRMMAGEFDFFRGAPAPVTTVRIARRDKYASLKAGKWFGLGYPSPSEADLALCSYLAQEFSSAEDIDAAFRKSGLMREKWERSDYRKRTIAKAMAKTTTTAPAPDGELSQYCSSLVEISQRPPQPVDWIIGKYAARGAITALFSKIKLGKTSLALSGVRAVLEGKLFLGSPTIQGSVVMLTEMSGSVLRAAFDRAGLTNQSGFTIMEPQHFYRLPTWEQRVGVLGRLCKRDCARLLIVDTLGWAAGLSGEDENSSGVMMRVMLPLQRLCSDSGNGLGILCLVHERKSGGDIADSIRGSSATGGAVDILMNLAKPAGNHRSETIRRINAIGRYPDTPAELVIDWNQGEYVVLGDSDHVTADRCAALISNLLPVAPSEAKTVLLLREESGESRTSIQRVLRKLVRDEEAVRLGSGSKNDSFRYHRTKWKM